MGRRWCAGRGRGGLGGVTLTPLYACLKRLDLKGRRILYAPRQPPTLVRLLRINTLLIYSLRCLASAVLMLTPWVGWDPAARGTLGGPGGGRALRARGRRRALRARARAGARALRARTAPSAPPGPRGQRAKGGIGIFPKVGRMEGYPKRKRA